LKLLVRLLLAGALAGAVFAASRLGAQQQSSPSQVEEDLRDFVPSEEIPADSAVSFPSDI